MRGIDFVFPSVTDNIIITWQLASAPSTEVGREVFPPSTDMQTCVPLNLKRKVYIFRFYSSSDGTTLETQLRPDWSVDGEMFGNVIETYHYVVDGPNDYDPESGQSVLEDPRLEGKVYEVWSRGIGYRRPDEYVLNDEDTLDPGFTLIAEQDGNIEQFNEGDTWTVQVIGEKESTSEAESGLIHEVTTSEAFNDDYYATNVAKGSGALLTTTFPAFNTLSDAKIKFTTYTGTQRYWRLNFVEDSVDFMGDDRNFIDLAQDEEIEFTIKDGVVYVSSYSGNYKKSGEIEMVNKKTMRGTFLCDGNGTEYNISDFQRMIDNLPEEMKVSYADWVLTQSVNVAGNTLFYSYNKGKFAVNNISGKFKFPDYRKASFRGLAHFDGTTDADRLSQGAGGMQAQQLISHDHGLPDDTMFNGGSFGGQQGSDDSKLDTNKKTDLTGGTEQRVDNIGKYIVAIL